jgi:hypothetical protein
MATRHELNGDETATLDLGQGFRALVDERDLPRLDLKNVSWRSYPTMDSTGNFYPGKSHPKGGVVHLNHVIAGLVNISGKEIVKVRRRYVRHLNKNLMDCRRANLEDRSERA